MGKTGSPVVTERYGFSSVLSLIDKETMQGMCKNIRGDVASNGTKNSGCMKCNMNVIGVPILYLGKIS